MSVSTVSHAGLTSAASEALIVDLSKRRVADLVRLADHVDSRLFDKLFVLKRRDSSTLLFSRNVSTNASNWLHPQVTCLEVCTALSFLAG